MLWSVIIRFLGIVVLPATPSLAAKALEVRLGAAVTLQCNLSYHYEINWVRMSSEMNPELLMVLGLNKNGDLSITWNSNSSSFQGFINNRFIHLKIVHVSQTDLVTYFCAAVNDKQIKLSEGMRLYALLDEKQTPAENLTISQGCICTIRVVIYELFI
ncbi:uncharacterized protein Hap1MRO34_022536 [Clarias gariepinus]